MSNLDDWNLYTREVQSPQPWVDASLYFGISTALQRRVWLGGLSRHPIFPNLYMAFVGPPAVGKSLIIRPMLSLLEVPQEVLYTSELEEELAQENRKENYRGGSKPAIHIAPNSTTFEQMTMEIAKCHFAHRYKDEQNRARVYHHSSVVFVLDEITSIFKHHSENLTDFLLQAYNCEDKYVRKTKHQGNDYCTNICMSLLGGTTPEKFRAMQNKGLMGDGFTSRLILIYGSQARFRKFLIPDLDTEQKAAKERLQKHVKKLIKLYGPMTLSPEAHKFCLYLFEQADVAELIHNKDEALAQYYGRKNLHTVKLAMAVHFAEKDNMVLDLEDINRALDILKSWELEMHIPYAGMGRDELGAVKEDMVQMISQSGVGVSQKHLFIRFKRAFKNLEEFQKCLSDLVYLGRIKTTTYKGEGVYVRK